MIADIIIIAVLVVVCFLIIRSMIKKVKSGKSICGCDGHCDKCNGCH